MGEPGGLPRGGDGRRVRSFTCPECGEVSPKVDEGSMVDLVMDHLNAAHADKGPFMHQTERCATRIDADDKPIGPMLRVLS